VIHVRAPERMVAFTGMRNPCMQLLLNRDLSPQDVLLAAVAKTTGAHAVGATRRLARALRSTSCKRHGGISRLPLALSAVGLLTVLTQIVALNCALYKSRWQVELFFKWIKQHPCIKRFFGTSEHAVKSQIWIAVSVYVLVAIVKKRLDHDASLYTLLQILSLTLFEKMPILQALSQDQPVTEPPPSEQPIGIVRQLAGQ
jgi:Transposase DDE domain